MAYTPGATQKQLAATYESLMARIKSAGQHLQHINEQTAAAEAELARIQAQIEQTRNQAAREEAKQCGQARRSETFARKAREDLATIRRQVDEAKTELSIARRHTAEARAQHSERVRTITYAHIAYANAVNAHPEDVVEGPKRLALLNHEARHLKAVS